MTLRWLIVQRRALLALGLLTAAWMATWIVKVIRLDVAGDLKPGYFTPEGYNETAELYLRHNWLVFDQARDQGRGGIMLRPALETGPIGRYFRQSSLAADVAAFNGGERSTFVVERGLILGIDPALHSVPLPFAERRAWRGRLTYRPGAGPSARLQGGGVDIRLSGPSRSLDSYEDPPRAYLTAQGNRAQEPNRLDDDEVLLFGGGGPFFGRVHMVGDAVLFNDRSPGDETEVWISGDHIDRGSHLRIDSGDLLKLQWRPPSRGSRYALLWSSLDGDAPLISAYRAINGGFRRVPEPATPQLGQEIVAAIDTALARQEQGRFEVASGREREEFNLALTLDARLQRATQEVLDGYVRELRAPNEPPFRAAITVMDARTGELLALASSPTGSDREQDTSGDRSWNRLLRNHNFTRMPVGSVAKAFFSAAIWDAAPWLMSLEIPGYGGGKFDHLLGIALAPPLKDHGIGGGVDHWIGLEEFIEHSSNKYAATLLTLATGVAESATGLPPAAATAGIPDALDAADQFRVAGVTWRQRPALGLPLGSNRSAKDPSLRAYAACGPIVKLELKPFGDRLAAFFDVPNSWIPKLTRPGADGDDLIDSRLWRPVLLRLYGSEESVPRNHPLRSPSPERENLAFNLMDQYRTEFLSLILGGGSSTWTPIRVATSFSRLITGRKIEARLVHSAALAGEDPEAEANRPPSLGLDEGVRQRLDDALTLVAGPEGTASALNPMLRTLDLRLASQGEVLGFFSKTGSPDNSSFVTARTARGLDELIRRGALSLLADGQIAYRGEVVDEEPETGTRPRWVAALAGRPGDRQALARLGVEASAAMAVCDSWNDALPVDRRQFEVRSGRLIRALARSEVESIGAAYVFTIAAYDQGARRPAASGRHLPRIDVSQAPKRALTVAIIIETQGTGPTVAVPLAGRLIERVLGEKIVVPR